MSTNKNERSQHAVSQDRREQFLVALKGEQRMNVTAACHAAGLQSVSGVYRERAVNPEFRSAWEEIEQGLLDTLEQHQYADAMERPEDRRWVLQRRRPKRWSEKTTIEVEGSLDVSNAQTLTDEQLEFIAAKALKDKDEQGE
jgi:hypothetical protein